VPRGEDLQNFPLLGSEDEPWQAWIEKGQEGSWLARAPIIDDSAGVIAAAEEGIGFALARWSLVQRSLEQGRVVLAGDALLPFRFSYFFVCPGAVPGHAQGQALPRLAVRHGEGLPQAARPVHQARREEELKRLPTSGDSLSFLDAGFRHRVGSFSPGTG
jgi:hypothetical protein